MPYTVAVLVGSLREGSLNRGLAKALAALGKGKLDFQYLQVGDLPLYNDDLWPSPPAAVTQFKQQIEAADAVLIVSPEYNRSFPGILGNAFDWGSRPSGKSSWRGKPVAICGITPGATGTAAAQQHLRLAALNLMMIPMTVPEAYLTWTEARFGADGEILADDTRKLLQGWTKAFAAWIERHG